MVTVMDEVVVVGVGLTTLHRAGGTSESSQIVTSIQDATVETWAEILGNAALKGLVMGGYDQK